MKDRPVPLTIGVDIGGTLIKMGLVRGSTILSHESIPTRKFSTPRVLQEILLAVIQSLRQKSRGRVIGVGVGVPGLVRSPQGIVHSCANLPNWRDVPLQSLLRKKAHLPVYVDNDVNLMTLGEWIYGAGRGVKNLVCMTLGTGVGGGLVIDGHLYRGASGWAGEIGHIPLGEEGPPCSCGGKACLERYVGNKEILQWVRQQLRQGVKSQIPQMIPPGGTLTHALIDRACRRGDRLAQKTWERVGVRVGIICAGLVNLLNPERIVVGGGISKAGRWLFEPLRATVRQRAMGGMGRIDIVPAQLGSSAGLIGAAFLGRGRESRE